MTCLLGLKYTYTPSLPYCHICVNICFVIGTEVCLSGASQKRSALSSARPASPITSQQSGSTGLGSTRPPSRAGKPRRNRVLLHMDKVHDERIHVHPCFFTRQRHFFLERSTVASIIARTTEHCLKRTIELIPTNLSNRDFKCT